MSLNKYKTSLSHLIGTFAKDDAGSVTSWSIIWSFLFLMIGGLSVDSTNAWRVRAHLQATADASALAGALKLAQGNTSNKEIKAAAIEISHINMPPAHHGNVLMASDIEIGEWDWDNKTFIANSEDANAVRVRTNRTDARGNGVRTFLLRLAGFGDWDVGANSISVMRVTKNNDCLGASFISESQLQLGGGNTVNGKVCFHGENSVSNGGGDLLTDGVKMSSNGSVNINYLRPGSADPEDIEVHQSMSTVVLPQVPALYQSVVRELSGTSNYSGDLFPDYIYSGGTARVEHHSYLALGNQPWQTPIVPNTIYVSTGQVQILGGMDVSNIAIVAAGGIIIGGSGSGVHFENVYFISDGGITASGSASWGNAQTYCDTGEYNTYLLSTSQLLLGGATSLHGVIGAAPSFDPGGSLDSAGGLYFESSSYTTLGGDMNIANCDEALESDFGTSGSGGSVVAHSTLVY